MRIHSSSQEESVRTGEDAGDSQEELHTVRGPSGRGQETHATDQRQGQVSPFPSHTGTCRVLQNRQAPSLVQSAVKLFMKMITEKCQ